ncbi:hypothetical protein CYLTODRAFT_462037, partial [Cylindrobasidium torrendii FP15055 ss-10]
MDHRDLGRGLCHLSCGRPNPTTHHCFGRIVWWSYIERLQVQIKLAVAVSGWLKLVLDVSWSWIALAFFGCSVLLLAEKLALHPVAIRFHQKALADRLAENQLALRALDRLS